jgi:predicted DNA-binding protein with PD1-like motif
MVRADEDADVIEFITNLAKKEGIKAGAFTMIGALKSATLGFFNQGRKAYDELVVEGESELSACMGNISIKNGQPFVHAHAVLGDEHGNTKSGHLLKGRIFAGEICIHVLSGPPLERKPDPETGLALWE